jgi:hypothetical protein
MYKSSQSVRENVIQSLFSQQCYSSIYWQAKYIFFFYCVTFQRKIILYCVFNAQIFLLDVLDLNPDLQWTFQVLIQVGQRRYF